MNDSNDKYGNLLFLVRSHSFSLILFTAGFAWTVMYIRSVMASTDTADLSQPTEMLFAGLALMISGVLAMPAVLDRVPQKAYRILLGVGVVGAAYFFMAATNSVLDEEQFQMDRARINATTIQRLTDIREELDRLGAHIAAARELLSAGAAIGRRLDFLCQELNRETNTICSKSGDLELTRIGLDLKAVVEQFREQVQNIE